MAILHCILGLIPALLVLEQSVCVLGKARPVEPINIRLTREVGAPAPIDCQLSGWGKWSECEPCAKQRYRSRSIVAFGQYGGRRCLSPLGDTQSCKPDKPCDIEPPVCPNSDFQCESGRCIKKRLVCNTDNDCGDFSDELCDDQEPKPTCRGGDIELSEIGRTAGNGLNILGMDTRSNPFDNEYFNGLCDRVRDGNTRLYYRKPWNVASLVYQTRADKSFTTETFEDSVQLISKMVEENTNTFGLSLSLKYTPTELNDTTITGGLGITSKKTERLETIKKYINAKNKIFMKVSGSVQLGTFNLRSRGAMLSSTFLEDVAFLPTTYDKGVYYEFLETYGTHYTLSGTVGGKYELVYVLDSHKIKTEEITTTDISNCLGFNLDLSVKAEGVDGKAKIENEKCKKVLDNTERHTTSELSMRINYFKQSNLGISI